jgi:cation:H+ antiporter
MKIRRLNLYTGRENVVVISRRSRALRPEVFRGFSRVELRSDSRTMLATLQLTDDGMVAADDVAYRKGPLLAAVSPAHAVSAFGAVIMSGIFIVALLYRPETRLRGTIGWVSLSLLLVYLFVSYAIYLHGH